MSRGQRIVVNAVAVNAGWFACILGAADGLAWIGPAVVLLCVVYHVAAAEHGTRELSLVLTVTVIGTVVDTMLTQYGTLRFESGMLGPLVPLWMMALWANFATVLNVALRFLHGRWLLAAILGGFGGASAYYGGASFGALSLGEPITQSVGIIAIEWAIMMPLMAWMAGNMRATGDSTDESEVTHG